MLLPLDKLKGVMLTVFISGLMYMIIKYLRMDDEYRDYKKYMAEFLRLLIATFLCYYIREIIVMEFNL